MSQDRYHDQSPFYYGDPIVGVVIAVVPITPQDRTLRAQVRAIDGRGTYFAYVTPTDGVSRHMRKNRMVVLQFRHGNAQYPVITGVIWNNEGSGSNYRTPLPAAHTYTSDLVIQHEETSGFLRFRSASATQDNPGPDGDACLFDLAFVSGAQLAVHEYPNGSSPPNRAKASFTMPSGASVTFDEPTQGQATLSLTMPSGAELKIDAAGNIALSSPGEITVTAPQAAINSPALSLGGPEGSGQSLAFTAIVEELRNFCATHTHSGVRGGPDTSGSPTSSPPEITGTTNALGQ